MEKKLFSFKNFVFEAGNIRMDFKIIHPIIWFLLAFILLCMILPTREDVVHDKIMDDIPLWWYPVYFGSISLYLVIFTPSKK